MIQAISGITHVAKEDIVQWCRSRKVRVVRCWKCGVEGHQGKDCTMGESEDASGGWSGASISWGRTGRVSNKN